MGGEEEKGTILGEPVLRGAGLSTDLSTNVEISQDRPALSGRSFLQKLEFCWFYGSLLLS